MGEIPLSMKEQVAKAQFVFDTRITSEYKCGDFCVLREWIFDFEINWMKIKECKFKMMKMNY